MDRTQRIAVPTATEALEAWSTDFTHRYGLPPFAGGETPGGGAPAATPAAPAAQEPAGAPQTPAGGQPAPAGGQAPQTPAQPGGEPQAAAAGETPPDWAQSLLERMDEIAPPAAYDPLAVELFGLEGGQPGQQAPTGQPLTPEQLATAQALGLLPQQPGAPLPGQGSPAMPGMLQPPPAAGQAPGAVPGLPGQEIDLVNRLIDQRAEERARQLIREEVDPRFQQQEARRRREDAMALTEDYEELRDPAVANRVVTRARQWAQQIAGNPNLAGEPGWIEVVFLAGKQLEAMQRAGLGGGQPGNGEVPIEQPGAATPGQLQTDSQQRADRIVQAGSGGGLSPFWK